MADEDRPSTEGVQTGLPLDPSSFDADPRISWSKLDNKFILETEEGNEFEWDTALKRWIPVLDQSLLDQQGEIYKVAGVDEDAATTSQKKKRKQPNGDEQSGNKSKKARVNTAVYVTSIPLDADQEEIEHVFSKCGVIAEEIDSGKPRIKMYEDDKGQFKGDALVVYFRPESVNLAVQMLDDTDFRLGTEGPMGKMRVQAADFSYKSQQDIPAKTSKREQKKVIQRTQKMQAKLMDWDDDDPQALQETSSKWDKVVILKHMFTLQELKEDPAAMLEIKEDIREECAKLGEVTNVVLFDKEAEGVASVRFSNAQAAAACVKLMNGRWFDERQLEAYIATGREKFKKSSDKKVSFDEDEDEEEADEGGRLDKFGSWLEQEK
ncbi:RNA recognition motif aka RRM, RBD, or RNP domain-containing protein [Cladophialophora immunda]|nr:RNA recognition motif aka RRM, RBD, or RNP domain-containing protein [Cladophialophora immunda]